MRPAPKEKHAVVQREMQLPTLVHKGLAVQVDGGKVLLRLLLVGRPQPLVVLDGPPGGCGLLPGLILWHCEERQPLLALGRLQQQDPSVPCSQGRPESSVNTSSHQQVSWPPMESMPST